MYLILATEERINYKYDNGIGNIVAEYDTPEEAAADIAKFTPEAVKEISFFDSNDNLLGEYKDLVFEGANTYPCFRIYGSDDAEEITGYECNFRLREKSEIEKRLDTHEEEITELQEAVIEL